MPSTRPGSVTEGFPGPVLSHPAYCPRFAFEGAPRRGTRPVSEVPGEAMMALVLNDSGGVPRGTAERPGAFGI